MRQTFLRYMLAVTLLLLAAAGGSAQTFTLKGLVTNLVISGLMLAAVTGILAFFWGLSVR